MDKLKMMWRFLTTPEPYELMSAGLVVLFAALKGKDQSGTIEVTNKDGTKRLVFFQVKVEDLAKPSLSNPLCNTELNKG